MAIPAYYSLIQRGSSGPDVALVQTWLNGIRDSCTWHAALTVDGKFGANAEKAVREFQLRYGLKEDGKVGANTWNVLYTPATRPNTASPSPTPASCCEAAAQAAASGWCSRSSTPRASGSPPTASSVPAPSPPSSATRPATA